MVGAVFFDEYVDRQIMVLSVHAPHNTGAHAYSLMHNLQHFVMSTLKVSGTTWTQVAHLVIGGDFNRDDWQSSRSLYGPYTMALHSAQGKLRHPVPTLTRAIDNILFGSREFRYQLELTEFYAAAKNLGSDHKPVVATFLS